MASGKCIACACTEINPCETSTGPCSWASTDVCTRCAGVVELMITTVAAVKGLPMRGKHRRKAYETLLGLLGHGSRSVRNTNLRKRLAELLVTGVEAALPEGTLAHGAEAAEAVEGDF